MKLGIPVSAVVIFLISRLHYPVGVQGVVGGGNMRIKILTIPFTASSSPSGLGRASVALITRTAMTTKKRNKLNEAMICCCSVAN